MPIHNADKPGEPAVWLYFAIAFLIPIGSILILIRAGGIPGTGAALTDLQMPVYLAMLAGPTIAAIVLTLSTKGVPGLRRLLGGLVRWRATLRETGAALLVVPLSVLVVLLGFSLVSPAYTPGILGPAHLAPPLLIALMGGAMAGLFEEIGWTGFATPRLLRVMSVTRAALVLGLLHSVWHLMAGYWAEGVRFGGVYPLYFITAWVFPIVALRLLIVWLYARTGSILVAVVAHAANTGGLILLWPTQTTPIQDVIWTAVFSVVLLVAVLFVTRRGGGDA